MAKLKAEDKIEEENKQKQTTESWKLQTSPKLGGWGGVRFWECNPDACVGPLLLGTQGNSPEVWTWVRVAERGPD